MSKENLSIKSVNEKFKDAYRTTPIKKALQVFPVEIWNDIIADVDIHTLFALHFTSTELHIITRNTLIEKLIQTSPLDNLCIISITKHPEIVVSDILYRMPKYIDEAVIKQIGDEPLKWTDDVREWEMFDPRLENYKIHEEFRKEVGRRGKAKSKIHAEWMLQFSRQKSILKRELAKCFAVAGKFYPFSREENREWKKRRLESGKSNDLWKDTEKGKKSSHSTQNQKRISPSSVKSSKSSSTKSALLKVPPLKPSTPPQSPKKTLGKNDWQFSHQIRNTPKPRRPNLGKGEEEFNKKILTSFVTPDHFLSPEDINEGQQTLSIYDDDDARPPAIKTTIMMLALKRFSKSKKQRVLKFPKELSAYQRKALHGQAGQFGLKSLSFGEGDGRFLVAMKYDVEIF